MDDQTKGGTENGANTQSGTENQQNQASGGATDTTDYKALYEAAKAERDALNQKNNTLSREAADLRKKEKDREAKDREALSKEEQLTLALADKEKEAKTLLGVINRQEIVNLFASKNVSEDIYTPIVDKLTAEVEDGKLYDHRKELATAILTAIATASEKAASLAKNGTVVQGTVKTTEGGEKSQFKLFQDQMNNQNNKGRVEL